jgi:predicted kinase
MANAEPKPILLLVSGPSGCGKTTLARALGDGMGIVHLCRDGVKSAIAASDAKVRDEGIAVVDAMKTAKGGEYGQRAFAVAYEAAASLLAGGASVVMDQAWRRGLSEAELRPLVEISRPALVTVVAPPDVAATRTAQRGDRPGLAGVSETVASLEQDWEDFLTLDLDVPQLVVDTSTGYVPSLPHIQAWVWRNAR